ncbi:hypothetical protein L249_4333 [Ophiocordyceps polyrhachis-furcata BCC 54312]|uniref:Dihydroorotate dehydrogenase catalytic domain-containing protein n=1 Tax=Ophiocordyceps polyrhachis-furcata BCC 54312 TaxID=1330021 RepID=A0A367L7V0_9HYPO|nr:hypothetical protein L249_4333 [Ophiocordyceps polyrhachis-furcata BCC 54312]
MSAAALGIRRVRAAQSLPRLITAVRRQSSTTSSAVSSTSSSVRAVVLGSAFAASLGLGYLYVTDTRASIHRWLVPPLLRLVFPDAEDGHHAATRTLRLLYLLNMHPRERASSGPGSSSVVFNTRIDNPIGISAGLDKDGEIPDALFALGAAVVEIGGCTAKPQSGNARPRVFRLPTLDGMVNRYGLNSRGADDVASRLRRRLRRFASRLGVSERDVLDGRLGVPPGSLQTGRLLAVQVAKNKDTDERDEAAVAADHVYCVRTLAPYADIIVVNVSSPNTPGLRDLQATEPLTRLLTAVVDEAARTQRASPPPRVMVKVSPDEDEDSQMEGIVQAVHRSGADGLIVGNTTKRRAGIVPDGALLTGREREALKEQGGYSGPAMFGRTLDLVARYRTMLDADSLAAGDAKPKVIFATGGITNGEQALRVLNAGASIAMIYTGLVYGGAGTVTRMKAEMRSWERTRAKE